MSNDQYLVTGFLDGDLLLFDLNSISGYKKYKMSTEMFENSVKNY